MTRHFAPMLAATVLVLALQAAAGARAAAQTTEIVSTDSSGVQGNSHSFSSSISADGSFVALDSVASNLVASDTNGRQDVFVHDRTTGETTRVSVATDGTQGDGFSGNPSISADGHFVAFNSVATNLVANDTNSVFDVFVHERATGQTTRASVASDGTQGNNGGVRTAISADGRFVAFDSPATNLVAGGTNGFFHVFVHDRGSETFDFAGFMAPVANPPAVNVVNAGRAVPVRFSLSGDHGLDILSAGFPVSQQIVCDVETAINTVEETATAGQSTLSYDAVTDEYVYVWKTERGWANTCRRLIVQADRRDGAPGDVQLREMR